MADKEVKSQERIANSGHSGHSGVSGESGVGGGGGEGGGGVSWRCVGGWRLCTGQAKCTTFWTHSYGPSCSTPGQLAQAPLLRQEQGQG